MTSTSPIELIALLLPLLGIALSVWSFKWSEDGATPDCFVNGETQFDHAAQIIEMGRRRRARLCAKLTFNGGALLLAASVPFGSASLHSDSILGVQALSGFAILIVATLYTTAQLYKVWLDRRDSSFSAYYDPGGLMYSLYDRARTSRLFFKLNPMPIWTLPDRQWEQKRQLPNINEVFKVASKGTIANARPVDLPEHFIRIVMNMAFDD